MTTNPLINALSATLYIAIIVNGISYMRFAETGEDTLFIPMAMLSLFTLSTAVMGYLFVYPALRLFLEGQREEAVTLFLQTVGIFAIITAAIFTLLFFGVLA